MIPTGSKAPYDATL